MSINTHWLHVLLIVVAASAIGGCASAPRSKQTLLRAPTGANVAAAHHNDEGIQAYQQKQWITAKDHFEAAIAMSPEFAEAHYNLGMVLYRLKAMQDSDRHFIQAANLAPGNKVIWDAPPLRQVKVSDKEVQGISSDGHMHSH